ncbi:hypothetical protein FRC04_008226 [Tulasnella sp. 424]|nr:hypothetical protein FRC04_008226 [Tulasnella sp. 424]KAG8974502.1 hypothetical protein FRC05_007301 [Tulasnella sp. 425]
MSQTVEAPPQPVTYGPAPFHADGKGDVILISSDGVYYKPLRTVLALASPVFADMFEIPQGPSTQDSGQVPTIDVSESSAVLHAMLKLFYPTPILEITSYPVAFGLIQAFDKYLVPIKGLYAFLKDFLTEKTIQSSPLESYALAWRLGWREKAELASRYLHERKLTDAGLQTYVLSHAGDVGALTALWDLRLRREQALGRFIQDLPLSTYRCSNHTGSTPQEHTDLQQNARKALATPFPERKLTEVLPSLAIPLAWKIPREVDTTRKLLLPTYSLRSPGVKSPSSSTLGPCQECQNATNYATAAVMEQRLRSVATAVEMFPKTINWTREEK